MIVIFMVLLAVALLVLGIPIGFALGLSAIVTALVSDMPSLVITIQMFSQANSFLLLAIPLFVFAGKIIQVGGIASDLLRLTELLIGGVRGGLSMAVVLAAMLLSGVTGSKTAEISALTSTAVPSLAQRKYDRNYATAVVMGGSAAGEGVPPSITLIVVAQILSLSVVSMFVAGLSVAILLALLLLIFLAIRGDADQGEVRVGGATEGGLDWREMLSLIGGGLAAVGLPVVVISGIRAGVFSATEGAGVAALYALIIVGVLYRRLSFRGLVQAAADSAVLSGVIMLMVMASTGVSHILSVEGVQFLLSNYLSALEETQWLLLLLTIVLFTFLGCVLEGLPAIIIFAPIVAPIAFASGMDPIHFSVLIVVATGVGLCLPPVGLGFLTGCIVARVSPAAVSRRYWPFALVLLLGLVLVAFLPPVATFLPNLLIE